MLDAHKAGWQHRWEIADVVIEGSDEAQQGIRFNLFQLFSTYYGEDARLNISTKGFTGEKYGGATYRDTEAYAVPLYLALAGRSYPQPAAIPPQPNCRRCSITHANRAWRAHSVRW